MLGSTCSPQLLERASLKAILLAVSSLGLGTPAVFAQTVYGPSPPTITTTINTTAGNEFVAGSTAIAVTGTTTAINVTGGLLDMDSTLLPVIGAITVQTVDGNALQADGGTIIVPRGNVLIQTQGGHAVLANGAGSTVTIAGFAPSTITTTGSGAGLVAIGGTINATNVVINNTGTASPGVSAGHGAVAQAGGTINLHAGTSIATGAVNSVGLGASGSGSRIIADALIPLTSNGRGAMGVYLHDGGRVSLVPGSTIGMNGGASVGITADNTTVALGSIGAGLTINLNGSAPGSGGSTGIMALNGGSVAIGSVTVTGSDASAGAWASSGSSIAISGRSFITINGSGNPINYRVLTPSLVAPVGTVASLFAGNGTLPVSGLLAQGTGAMITSTGTTITVHSGNGAAGVAPGQGGLIEIIDNTITTTGVGSYGVRIDSTGTLTGRDSRIASSGGGAALYINGGAGTIELSNTTVQASGAGTLGLSALNFTASGTNSVRLFGGSLIASGAAAISAEGPLNFLANGAAVTGGDGFLLLARANSLGPQATAVDLGAANGSVLTGHAQAGALATANIALTTGSRWTGAAFDISNVAVDPTSNWTSTASSTVRQLVANAGLIQLTPPGGDPTQLASFKTLTTQNYLGAGGTIGLNTYLGSDGSASDRLVINGGAATGNSFLRFTNAAGEGSLTTGNGILVVDAINGGTTTAGAFSLAGHVIAGPYEYELYRGSVDGSGTQNWYLRSDVPTTGGGSGNGGGSTGGGSTGGGSTGIPNFRREVSLLAALPAMGLIYGRTLIDSLHERAGASVPLVLPPVVEEHTVPCGGAGTESRCTTRVPVPANAAAASQSHVSVGWARIVGQHGNRDGGPWGIFRNGPNYDYDLYALQAGLDLYRRLNADGSRDHAGIYAAIGRIEGDVTHFNGVRAGKNTIDGYSLGAYWTHFGPSGWYLDGVVQGTWYEAKADSQRLVSLKRDAFGFAASLEGGYPIQLGNGFTLEPQAQVIYQTISSRSGHDGAALVRFSDVDSLAARIGARLAKSWTLEDASASSRPRMMTAWLKASLWNEFFGSPKTSFSSAIGPIAFRSDLGGAWAEVKAGIETQLSRHTALYATAGYQIGLDGRSHAYDGRLGIKVSW